MKKIVLTFLALLLLLSGCSSTEKSSETSTEATASTVVEESSEVVEPEPLYYSAPIYIYATKESGIKTVEDLSGKTLAVQKDYDHEASDYVLEQLAAAGISGFDTVEAGAYGDLPNLLNEKSIDAWVISDGYHQLLPDYRGDYKADEYTLVGEYAIPFYEEKVLEDYILSCELYNEPFAVMITGIDERVSPDAYTSARNDVDLLMVVNPKLHHITTVSFPRDSYITNSCNGVKDKLTHFGMKGTECIKNSIGKLLGDVWVPYFVQVSFSSFIDMIDSLGGVYVDVPLNMTMDQDSHRNVKQPYSLEEGNFKLWGEWALALARNRKYSNLWGGDYGRIRNQALIVNSIIARIAEYPFLPDWAGWSWKDLTYDNLNGIDVQALFALAEEFHDGYTIDNYFIVNNGSMTESGMSIGLIPESSRMIAELKVKLTLTGEIDPSNAYYEEAMTGYVSRGASTQGVGPLGDEYDLRDVFTEYKDK